MEKNKADTIHEEYLQYWTSITQNKAKLLRLKGIKENLSKDKYNTLEKEYTEQINLLENNFETVKLKAKSTKEKLQTEIDEIKIKLDLIKKNRTDIKVLRQNDLMNENLFLVENKNLETEYNKLEQALKDNQEIVLKIKKALEYPDPNDHAESIENKRTKEKDIRCKKPRFNNQHKDASDKIFVLLTILLLIICYIIVNCCDKNIALVVLVLGVFFLFATWFFRCLWYSIKNKHIKESNIITDAD